MAINPPRPLNCCTLTIMKATVLGSLFTLATITASAQTDTQGTVTVQFETDRPAVHVTYADGVERTVELNAADGQTDGDRLGSALALVKAYESAGWTVVSSESCKGVSSSHYTWVVAKPKH